MIAADTTALPEVVDESGILLDPDDEQAWTAAMLELLTDQTKRMWLAEAGIARTAEFRWSSSAEQLHGVYRRVARELEAAAR